MDLGLRTRVAFVTGSSQGIGSAIARLFAREGARVAITYRTNRDKALALATEIEAEGGEAIVVAYDLASRESIRSAVAEVAARWGGVDCLVNNAVERESGAPRSQPAFEQLPKELGPDGILVNVVMAGFTLTERVRDRFPASMLDEQAAQSPLRRLPTPSDVASTVGSAEEEP